MKCRVLGGGGSVNTEKEAKQRHGAKLTMKRRLRGEVSAFRLLFDGAACLLVTAEPDKIRMFSADVETIARPLTLNASSPTASNKYV